MTPTPDLKAAALAATLDIEQERQEFAKQKLAEMSGLDGYTDQYICAAFPWELKGWLAAKRSMAARLQVAEDAAKDAERLNFLIEKHATACNDFDADEPTEPNRHWLEYSGVDGSEVWVQMSDHATPREAIDAAIAARRLTP